jgi:hypothetical protein
MRIVPSPRWPRSDPNAIGEEHLAHDINIYHCCYPHPYQPFGLHNFAALDTEIELDQRGARDGFPDAGPGVQVGNSLLEKRYDTFIVMKEEGEITLWRTAGVCNLLGIQQYKKKKRKDTGRLVSYSA